MINAVVDLTEIVRMAMQRPERSPLFKKWEAGTFTWFTSLEMLAEFKQVTARPRLARYIHPAVRDAVARALMDRAVFVTPAAEFPHCRDPKDDIVIATAIAGRSNFIVTADRDLYDDPALVTELRERFKIQVVQAGEFLSMLNR